jgi:hypothetical protein
MDECLIRSLLVHSISILILHSFLAYRGIISQLGRSRPARQGAGEQVGCYTVTTYIFLQQGEQGRDRFKGENPLAYAQLWMAWHVARCLPSHGKAIYPR